MYKWKDKLLGKTCLKGVNQISEQIIIFVICKKEYRVQSLALKLLY